ncbi:MAG TPA: ABC transporter substrate-binding protein, partial [Verrucomicrobiae bacterium]|nr:ABC transporter substrate-binding protein [Verrucomicrobiae bacterium]
ITGITSINSELAAKRLDLLRTIAPRASRIAMLWDGTDAGSRLGVQQTEAAAKTAGVSIHSVPVGTAAGLEAVFASVVRGGAKALIIVSTARLFSDRKRLAELAVKHRLPTVVGPREFVEAGGLLGYAADFPDLFRRAATFADKILKGAKPGDLPVEQPTKFKLVINLKTAKALGLTIPQSLLLQADEVIQ